MPQVIADDAKLRHLVPDPFGFGIEAGDRLAGAGFGHIMFVVPDADACVELIVDDARPASHIAADARIAPRTSSRTGQAISVEVARNGKRTLAIGELAKNALDDQSLRRIDLAFAAYQLALIRQPPDHAVAIADSPCREALLDPPAQTAMRLLGKVFQEQRIHRAFEADMQFRDFAFGKRDQRHARELEMLKQGGDIGLVARHPVESFGDHHIELSGLCVGEQLLDARTQDHTRARDGRILEAAHNLPSLARRALAADTLLVGDRRSTLLVRGIAGIKCGADHHIFLWNGGTHARTAG